MKIGFFSYEFLALNKYYQQLKDKADCWWGVADKDLYNTLKSNNIDKIVYHPEEFKENKLINKTNAEYEKTSSLIPIDNDQTIKKKIVDQIDPDIWVTDSSNKINTIVKTKPLVQTFHALPIKKHVFHKPILDYDLILLPGPYHKEKFIKKFNLNKNDCRFKVVGWPRSDDLLNKKYNRERILKKLGLDINKKTLLYAPTWGWGYGNTSLFARWFDRECEIFEKLCQTASNNNLNFIAKIHCYSFASGNQKLIEIAKKYNVLWPMNSVSNCQPDPNEYLWITDILISDLSGIISEFMVLDRPIIYIDPDENIEPWSNSDMPKNFRAGYIIKKPEELFEAIKDSTLYPKRHTAERKEFCSKVFFNLDGKASTRAANEILNFAQNR